MQIDDPRSNRSLMERRHFLALGLAAIALPGVAVAEPIKPKALRFGFSLYGMRSLPLLDALQLCHSIGYDCVELPAMADWPGAPERLTQADRSRLRDQLQETGLRLSAVMENLTLLADDAKHSGNLKRLAMACQLGRELSPSDTPVVETVMGGAPASWEEKKSAMVERLRAWSKVAEQTETIVAIKAHISGAAHLPEHIRWLLAEVNSPWLKAAFDFSHFQLRGLDLPAAWKTLAEQTVFIHIKDSVGDQSKFQFVLPGQGSIDYVQYFRLLKEDQCQADVVVEVSGQLHSRPGYDAKAAAHTAYSAIAPAFAQADARWTKQP